MKGHESALSFYHGGDPMNMLQFELFASVARTQNISRTAEQYNVSQPAVSHQLKTLEQAMGLELIHRTKRGVVLTDAGRELLPYVQEILAIKDRAETRMRNMAEGTVGHIRIAALSSSSNQVSDCLLPLYAEHPDIQVDISLMEGTELFEALRQNSHDFYFGVDTMTPDNMGYTSVMIARGQLKLFVNRAVADTIDLSDWSTVARQPFVSVPKSDVSLDKKIMTICRNRGFTPRIISIYNRAESVVLSVNAGLGIAILPGALQELYQRPNVVTFPIEGDDARADTVFVWNPDRLTDTGVVFRNTVLKLYNQPLPD